MVNMYGLNQHVAKESVKYVNTGYTLAHAAEIQNDLYDTPQIQRFQANGQMLIIMKSKTLWTLTS